MDLDPVPQKKSRGGLIAAIVVLVALVIGGVLFFNQQKKNNQAGLITPTVQPLPSDTPTPEATGSATPSVSVKPTQGTVTKATEMHIQILNGSGAEGAATEAKTLLADNGYKNLETGNADNFDYQNVTIKIKSADQKFLPELQKILKEKYTLASGSSTLSSDALFDAQVIIGK